MDVSFNEQLINAIEKGDINEVEYLLKSRAHSDAQRLIVSSSYNVNRAVVGTTYFIPQVGLAIGYRHQGSISALGYAINLAHMKIAELLIDRGADINGYSFTTERSTHLNNAATLGRTEIVKLLLKSGADVNVRDISGYTALHSAVRSFNYIGDGTEIIKEIVNLLLDNGLDINAQDNDGCTALHIAATYKRIGITKLLLKSGADVNIRNNNGRFCYGGNTALHEAISSNHSDIKTVELLLKYNSNINILNSKGETPISLVLKNQRKADVFFYFTSLWCNLK